MSLFLFLCGMGSFGMGLFYLGEVNGIMQQAYVSQLLLGGLIIIGLASILWELQKTNKGQGGPGRIHLE